MICLLWVSKKTHRDEAIPPCRKLCALILTFQAPLYPSIRVISLSHCLSWTRDLTFWWLNFIEFNSTSLEGSHVLFNAWIIPCKILKISHFANPGHSMIRDSRLHCSLSINLPSSCISILIQLLVISPHSTFSRVPAWNCYSQRAALKDTRSAKKLLMIFHFHTKCILMSLPNPALSICLDYNMACFTENKSCCALSNNDNKEK